MEAMLGDSPTKAQEKAKEKEKQEKLTATEESLKRVLGDINKINERIDQLEEINMEL